MGRSRVMRTSRSSRVAVRIWVLPLLQKFLRFLQQCLVAHVCQPPGKIGFPRAGDSAAYPLQSRIGDISVFLEERPDVERLAAPEVAVHRPIEGQLQRAAVEGSGANVSGVCFDPSRRRHGGTCITNSAACLVDMVGSVVCGVSSCAEPLAKYQGVFG